MGRFIMSVLIPAVLLQVVVCDGGQTLPGPVICPLRPCVLPADCQLIIPPDPDDPCACPTCALDCSTVLCALPTCPNPVTPEGQCCPVCSKPTGPPDCSAVLCLRPDCPNPVVPEGECCGVCPEEPTDPPIDCSLVRCAFPRDCLNPVVPEGQCCPICPEPTGPPDCSAVLCLRPDCPNPVVPEGECCGVCPEEEPTEPEESCPIEGQVFMECGTACPLTCAEPSPKICTLQCVIGCQCPAGTVLDEVANKCVQVDECTCPPDCTRDFCVANPRARCNIPGPREIPGCFGQCQLTFCRACYFSEEARDLPGNCRDCGSPVTSKRCLRRWSRCIHRADIKENGRPDPSCITQEKFKCYRYPCQLRG